LVALEVEGIGHHQTVEGRQIQWLGEVPYELLERDLRKATVHRVGLLQQRGRVPIDGVNRPFGPEEIRQRECECAAT